MREKLGLPADPAHRVVLTMGGGEGNGDLSSIVDALYVELCGRTVDATVVVVCGRNAELRGSLEGRDWAALRRRDRKKAERRRRSVKVADKVRKMLSSFSSAGDLRSAGADAAGADAAGADAAGADAAGADSGRASGPGAAGEPADAAAAAGAASGPGSGEKNEALVSPSRHCLDTEDVTLCGSTLLANPLCHWEFRDEKEHIISVVDKSASPPYCASGSSSSDEDDALDPPSVKVVPLGFVTNMAEYMVSADLLLTKAGPGTIAEAASLGLPVLLTSYLPGQEEGNVDFVLQNGFGAFVSDSDPEGVAQQCSKWLQDGEELAEKSRNAIKAGVPNAAEEIARFIGKSVVRWMNHFER